MFSWVIHSCRFYINEPLLSDGGGLSVFLRRMGLSLALKFSYPFCCEKCLNCGSHSRLTSNISSTICLISDKLSTAEVRGSKRIAWKIFLGSPSVAPSTANCSGNGPTWTGSSPHLEARTGTSTQHPSGRLSTRPKFRTLPLNSNMVPSPIVALKIAAAYSLPRSNWTGCLNQSSISCFQVCSRFWYSFKIYA
jgi:hypothetical protein